MLKARSLFYSTSAVCFMLIPAASACQNCFLGSGTDDSSIAKGMSFFILFLLGFIGLVLGGIVAFFFHLRKMAKLAALSPDNNHSNGPQHSPLWHLQQAHAASGIPSGSDFAFSPSRQHQRRTFSPRDRGSQT